MTGQLVSCSTNGLLCRDVDQSGGSCYDYEIRFKCEASTALPIPQFVIDMSGKANPDDMDPITCDSIGETIYEQSGLLNGTIINNRHFYLKDGPPSSSHACSIWAAETSKVDFSPLLTGKCFSRPLCCDHGQTVEFWGYIASGPQTSIVHNFFSIGGHRDEWEGLTCFFQSERLQCYITFTEPPDCWRMTTWDNVIVDEWFHVTHVFDRSDNSACMYVNGVQITCKTPYKLVSHWVMTRQDNLRLFGRNHIAEASVTDAYSPDGMISDLQVYFYAMNSAEVSLLYERQTTGAYVQVYYVGRVSVPQYEDVVLECKARNAKDQGLSFRWVTSSDGQVFTDVDPLTDPKVFQYSSSLNSYQWVGRLHIVDHPKVSTYYGCAGYDTATDATSSRMFQLTFDPEESSWTPWMSSDSPDDNDDDESLVNIRNVFPQVCSNPLSVECRTLYTKTDHSMTGESFLTPCTTAGLQCIGSSQVGGKCSDYEVRFQCPGVNFRWTSWYNADDPGSGSIEDETFSNHKAQAYPDLCEFPAFAECRAVSDGTVWLDAPNNQLSYPYICNKNGLYCSGTCSDFEVRYACPYYAESPGPDYLWEFAGRSSLSNPYPSSCGTVSAASLLATYPSIAYSGVAFGSPTYTSAPTSVEPQCAVLLDGTGYIHLGDYSYSCITDASRCPSGITFSFWFQLNAVSSTNNAYFVSSGSQTAKSKGLAFYQLANDGNFVIAVKTRERFWEATVDKSHFPLNMWKHVHVSINPPSGFTYYLDGVYQDFITDYRSSTYNVQHADAATRLILGAENVAASKYGSAAFSNFRVYHYALQEAHVAAFTACGETDGDLRISSLTKTSPELDVDLTLECDVWGYPAPVIEWRWSDDISQAGAPSLVNGPGVTVTESDSTVGCTKKSTLFVPNYASSAFNGKTVVCTAYNDVQRVIMDIEVVAPTTTAPTTEPATTTTPTTEPAYTGPLDVHVLGSITLGETVTLECVAGDPLMALSIEWYYLPSSESSLEVTLANDPLHQITTWTNGSYGVVSHLHLELFSLRENGVYTCAVNSRSKVASMTLSESKGFIYQADSNGEAPSSGYSGGSGKENTEWDIDLNEASNLKVDG